MERTENYLWRPSTLVNNELGYEAFLTVILGSDQGRDVYKKKLLRLSEQYRYDKTGKGS